MHNPSGNQHRRTYWTEGWVFREKLRNKLSWFFFPPFPCGIFVCIFFFSTSEDLANHHLFFVRDVLVFAHHGNSETMNVKAHSVMGRTIRGKWESNSQSASLSHLYMCVDLLFQREKAVMLSASACFSTSVELVRKGKGCFLFLNFQKTSFCHQNSRFG